MIVNTQALVFSAIKYSEADLIVCCFTESHGIKSYLLRNVLKAKKSKIKASYFQPLTQLELVATHKNKGTLEYIREVKVAYPYKSLHTDITKSSVVMFLAEILKNCIREEEPNPLLFQFLQQSLQWLDHSKNSANFHIYFLLRLSDFLGFYPDASQLELPYFNIQEGNFQLGKADGYCVEGTAVENLKKFFATSFPEMESVRLSQKARAELVELLLDYYHYHVQGYQRPKSLDILHQLFR